MLDKTITLRPEEPPGAYVGNYCNLQLHRVISRTLGQHTPAPGGSFSLEMSTPFKLTEEMLDVMGGLRSPLFSEFVTLFCCGFLALQSHCDTFLTLVEITSRDSTFKCFEGRDPNEMVSKFRERFCPDLDKEDTISYALDLIKQATTSYGTRQYDLYQYLSQGIVT
jgi:phosphatidylinositol 4-kinase B